MTTKRQHSSVHSEKEELRRCRHSLRKLLGDLGQTLPSQQTPFHSALLLHFHRSSHRVGLTSSLGAAFKNALLTKNTRGESHHGRT